MVFFKLELITCGIYVVLTALLEIFFGESHIFGDLVWFSTESIRLCVILQIGTYLFVMWLVSLSLAWGLILRTLKT
jgi:hypothetical protein